LFFQVLQIIPLTEAHYRIEDSEPLGSSMLFQPKPVARLQS